MAELPPLNHDELITNLFNKLPGFVPSAPCLEHRLWRRLPAILLWGTLLPLGLAGVNRALAPAVPSLAAHDADRAGLWFNAFGGESRFLHCFQKGQHHD